MSNAVIGALRVSLGLDSAAFAQGLSSAQSRMAEFGKRMGDIGARMQKVGAGMTAAVSVPIAGVAAAVQSSANSLVELDNQAKMLGLTAEKFKILTMAAGEFGVGQDKVADVLKDSDDKIGDFLQTGGGPLADFFENIAPKVGVTADNFRDLNSADALQLYVSSLEKANLSQSEMTFYMEAMASDLTLLAPVFRDNGKAIADMEAEAKRLGLAIDGNLIAAARTASKEFGITKDVLGIQMQQALVRLAPAVSQLIAVMVPAIEALSGWVTKLGNAFSALDPGTQAFAAGMAVVAAVIGPVVAGIGFLVAGIAAIGLPVAAAIAGIAALTAAVVAFWPEIKAAGAAVMDFFTTLPARIGDAVNGFSQRIADMATAAAQAVTDTVEALQDLGGRIVAQIGAAASEAYAAALTIGSQIIDGIKAGIAEKWESLRQTVTGLGDAAAGWLKQKLRIFSPSRVFREIGGQIMDGLRIGINDGLPGVRGAMQGVGDVVQEQGQRIGEFGSMVQGVFRAVALEGASLGKTLRSALGNYFGNAASNLFNSAFTGLWGALRLPAFANGTNFAPGGMALVGEEGPEIVNLPRGSRVHDAATSARMMGGGAMQVTVTMDPSTGALGAFVRDQAGRIVAQAAPAVIDRAVGAVWQRAQEVPLP